MVSGAPVETRRHAPRRATEDENPSDAFSITCGDRSGDFLGSREVGPFRGCGASGRQESRPQCLRVGAALAAASPLASLPRVHVTGFRRGFLNFGVDLTADEDSRACEIEPQQKRRYWIQSAVDPLG